MLKDDMASRWPRDSEKPTGAGRCRGQCWSRAEQTWHGDSEATKGLVVLQAGSEDGGAWREVELTASPSGVDSPHARGVQHDSSFAHATRTQLTRS